VSPIKIFENEEKREEFIRTLSKVLILQVHLLNDGETVAVSAFSIRTVSTY